MIDIYQFCGFVLGISVIALSFLMVYRESRKPRWRK